MVVDRLRGERIAEKKEVEKEVFGEAETKEPGKGTNILDRFRK